MRLQKLVFPTQRSEEKRGTGTVRVNAEEGAMPFSSYTHCPALQRVWASLRGAQPWGGLANGARMERRLHGPKMESIEQQKHLRNV